MITLYTAGTPNGRKAAIALEELELPYTVRALDFARHEQKEPWYLEINPNGRIPAIDDDGFRVFESGAILLYLAEKTGRLMPTDPRGRSRVVQWLMFQMGGVGPMMGQASHFLHQAPEPIPYAIARYGEETRRLLEVLDGQLAREEYLAGEYSIADIATWPWATLWDHTGVTIDDLPNLQRWLAAVGARPAVQRGRLVPRKA